MKNIAYIDGHLQLGRCPFCVKVLDIVGGIWYNTYIVGRGGIAVNTYITSFRFWGGDRENAFYRGQKMTCYNNFYPFGVLQPDFTELSLAPITILYGGNGSGKSTVRNIMAEKLGIPRAVRFNKSSFSGTYVDGCSYETAEQPPTQKILTSDDVFQSLFTLRERNEVIDKTRADAFAQRREYRDSESYRRFTDVSLLGRGDELRTAYDAQRMTESRYAKSRAGLNVIGKSNGETALDFFAHEMANAGLYLLDEPENSLSAAFQLELTQFLWDAVRFFGAQLVIATHSPFLLSLSGARIYNLDTRPVSVTEDWTTLSNMRTFYAFFKEHAAAFDART